MSGRIALGLAVSAALLVALGATLDAGAVMAALGAMHWSGVALAALMSPLALAARAVRWRFLFAPGHRPPRLLAATMIGYMLNNVLPLRAGELARAWVAARGRPEAFWTVLGSLVAERVLDVLALVLVLGGVLLAVPVPAVVRWAAVGVLAAGLAGAAALVLLVRAPAMVESVIGRALGRWPAACRRVLAAASRFVDGLTGLRARENAGPLLAWTAACWLVPVAVVWLVVEAADLALPWVAPWTVLALVALGVSVPSAPGAIGPYHAAAAVAVGIFGVPWSQAVGFALVMHAVQFVPVTLVGAVFLALEPVDLAAARAVTRAPGPVR
jgi:uncharacterized protein (TIRG00374 family)